MSGETPRKPARRRHFFLYPWPGAVDLYSVSALTADQCRVNVQLFGGGFQRSEARPDSHEIVSQMLDVLETLDGVEVTRYSRGGVCNRTESFANSAKPSGPVTLEDTRDEPPKFGG